MKIKITIDADHEKELRLYENSDKLKQELLNVVKQFVGDDVCIFYEKENVFKR